MSAEVADLIFVGLAHVEDEQIFFRIQTPLQLFDLNFRNFLLPPLFPPRECRRIARSLSGWLPWGCVPHTGQSGFLRNFSSRNFHAEGVDQQQTSDKRFAHTQD